MKKLVVALALLACTLDAASCPMSQALVERYGISFSGFEKHIPLTQAPEITGNDVFVRVAIEDKTKVSDGFRHAALVNKNTMKAWILRTGGFLGVYEWFGPVDVDNLSLERCRFEPVKAAAAKSDNSPH